MPRAALTLVLTSALALASPSTPAQSAPARARADLPTFDAATIKPPDPAAQFRKSGFYGEAGGRIFFGGNLRMLIVYAYNLQPYQIAGGPDWTGSQWFEINAVPPENSPSRGIKVRNADPTADQRLMLQSLLRDRFGFKSHIETRDGEVYILTRGTKQLELKPPKDPDSDPRANVVMKQGGIVDGEARGNNATTDYLAFRLSYFLKLPVLNQTGIIGSYDFYLAPADPENHDLDSATLNVVDRLGLKIKRARGPIQTLVIDHVEQPSEN